MFPIYFVVGLINIFGQHSNYGIKIEDPNFDIRVRRSAQDTATKEPLNIHNNDLKTDIVSREKRYAYYKKIKIPINDLPRYNYSNGNNNIQGRTFVSQNNGNNNNGNAWTNNNVSNNIRYTISNPNWNFLFNTTRNNRNNGNHSGINGYNVNNRPYIRSYPYGYPTGYGPRTNATPGYNRIVPTTPGYKNMNITPYFYNYQNPNGYNFAGFNGYNASNPGYNVTPGYNVSPTWNMMPNNNGSNYNAPWNNMMAPYPPYYTQKPMTNTALNNYSFAPSNNNYSNQYAPTNNSGVFYNNFNNTPAPYAPNFIPISVNNSSVTPISGNGKNTTATTTEKIVSGCVICNIPCPQFMRRFGRFCVDVDADNDY